MDENIADQKCEETHGVIQLQTAGVGGAAEAENEDLIDGVELPLLRQRR